TASLPPVKAAGYPGSRVVTIGKPCFLTPRQLKPGYGGDGGPRPMRDVALVTDDDLARARLDPAFRHQLVADNLELLLASLNKMRARPNTDGNAGHIREGVDLAVKLAELLQRIDAARATALRVR